MKTSDILIASCTDAFFALSSMDRTEADQLLDAYVAAYDAAPEHVERTAEQLFTAPIGGGDKDAVAAEFNRNIRETYMAKWIASLTNEQADCLRGILQQIPSGNAAITIAYGVTVTADDLRR